MANPATHASHGHAHGAGCGHPAIEHGDHVDYVHESHLHHAHGDRVDECRLDATSGNPAACTPAHACGAHDTRHAHGAACGHPSLPHAGHTDYLVQGHLHSPHTGHCDDHGGVRSA